jgi:GNAT superfamily N-acetyltransferase
MLQVQTMSGDDFAFAVRLTDTMSWKLAEEDFQFMTAVEPEGCFIIRDAAERIGVATTIRFGQVGWLGNVIVREEHRGRGAGSLLVQHALDYLTTHGVQTIGLYAYPNRIPFYLRLGLVYDSDFLVLTGHADPPSEQDAPRAATAHDTRAILDLDHRCFGASRRKVLTPLLRAPENGCYVSLQEEALRGFVVVKVYAHMAEVGPLVCQRGCPEVAVDLVKAALNRVRGREVVVCLPAKEAFLWRPLLRWGLREAFRVARMFYGSPQLTDCIHMAESLERG